ncbi:unnamed protein product [Spirodela intermedia]|uniref:Uncharacterized protein n=1 Tax=Spirodela intermedia TaxID=51605 RepID=A0A7I8IBU0_SPIIN|nr:unnamed protein product [Spirodela intermedia]CAA6655169.1 unnamed protein product [Spirodela intermedia]
MLSPKKLDVGDEVGVHERTLLGLGCCFYHPLVTTRCMIFGDRITLIIAQPHQMTEKVNSWVRSRTIIALLVDHRRGFEGDGYPLEGLVPLCAGPSKSLSSKASKTSKVFEVRGFFPLPKGEGAFPVPFEVREVEPP